MNTIYEATVELSVLLGHELCDIRFDPQNMQQRFVMTLYASTLELGGDAIILAQRERYSGIPIITRSMLEACVQMRALIKDAKYYNRMIATLRAEEIQMAKNALELNKTLALDPAYRQELEKRQRDAEEELRRLGEQGFKRVRIKEAFALAGVAQWYSPIYSTLCSHSHNNLPVLAHRHFEQTEQGWVPVFEREWKPDEVALYMANVSMAMKAANDSIIAFFGLSASPRANELWAIIEAATTEKK